MASDVWAAIYQCKHDVEGWLIVMCHRESIMPDEDLSGVSLCVFCHTRTDRQPSCRILRLLRRNNCSQMFALCVGID